MTAIEIITKFEEMFPSRQETFCFKYGFFSAIRHLTCINPYLVERERHEFNCGLIEGTLYASS